jgi:hypothetical protein
MRHPRPAPDLAGRLAVVILAAVAITAALTFRDYGLGWDDFTHSQYGDLLLKLYGSGFADARALSFVNLYKYGGGFDMAAALAAKFLPFDLFETRRLIGAAIGIIGLLATWRLARRLGGPLAGLSALALLAACPLFIGHMFMNAKDAPFAVAMMVLMLGAVRALLEYPRPSPRTVALFGVGLGAAFGSRVLAGLAAPEIAAGVLLLIGADGGTLGWRLAAARLGRFLWTLLPGFVLAYLIMGLLWPWGVLAPLNPFRALEYFDKFFEKPWQELYEGHLIEVPDMPASYLPHLFMLKLPELMLALGLLGSVGALVVLLRRANPPERRASLLTLLLAVYLPIIIAMITRPALYNGVRHFLFLVPPFAVLGGLATCWLVTRLRRYGRVAVAAFAALFLAGIAVPVVGMARLHPYEYTYFNPLAGGVRGAQDRYMLDYWGLGFKQAAEALRDWLAAQHLQAPNGRRWVVAICGPQAAASVELGPQFETTFDRKKSDFALALGTFYCRHLQAPIIADITRDGVSYARAYDLRGRAKQELLTVPPPQ